MRTGQSSMLQWTLNNNAVEFFNNFLSNFQQNVAYSSVFQFSFVRTRPVSRRYAVTKLQQVLSLYCLRLTPQISTALI